MIARMINYAHEGFTNNSTSREVQEDNATAQPDGTVSLLIHVLPMYKYS
jgi:hypothetical protein